jgi:hypothetical protein
LEPQRSERKLMLTYEQQLKCDPDWALLEQQRYLQQESAVHQTLRRLVHELESRGVDYSVAGDLCMFFHGLRRFTDVVELLVTPEGMCRIHDELVGNGFVRPSEFDGSIRDTQNGVLIKFDVSGEFAGAEPYNPLHN